MAGYSFSRLLQLLNPGAAVSRVTRSEVRGAAGRVRLLGKAGSTTGAPSVCGDGEEDIKGLLWDCAGDLTGSGDGHL